MEERKQGVGDGAEALARRPVHHIVALPFADEKAGVQQLVHVARDGAFGQVEEAGQLLRAARGLPAEVQNAQPHLVGQGGIHAFPPVERRAEGQVMANNRVDDGRRPRRVALHAREGPGEPARHEEEMVVLVQVDNGLVPLAEAQHVFVLVHDAVGEGFPEEGVQADLAQPLALFRDVGKKEGLQPFPFRGEALLPKPRQQPQKPRAQRLRISQQLLGRLLIQRLSRRASFSSVCWAMGSPRISSAVKSRSASMGVKARPTSSTNRGRGRVATRVSSSSNVSRSSSGVGLNRPSCHVL